VSIFYVSVIFELNLIFELISKHSLTQEKEQKSSVRRRTEENVKAIRTKQGAGKENVT
jgi:hypothetical protein